MSNQEPSSKYLVEDLTDQDFPEEFAPSSFKKNLKKKRRKKAKHLSRSDHRSASAKHWTYRLKLIAFDLVMIAIGLVIFAYFHHVRQVPYTPDEIITIPRYTATPTPAIQPTPTPEFSDMLSISTPDIQSTIEITPSPSPSPSPTPDPNDWGAKFADKFVTGYAEITDTSYRSENVSITIERVAYIDQDNDPQVYFVADIYIRDIDCLRTAFAEDTYGQGYREWPAELAHNNGAILAISGDYYSAREKGVVIRNGEIYRSSTFKDVCIIYYDGVMETIAAKEFDINDAITRSAYQAFSFGPALLDENGKAKAEYDSEITSANPRCAIGYFEPGHYCFVVANGRQEDGAVGLTMQELAKVFEDMGCAAAYNLDGGATASMVFMNQIVNTPSDGGRKVSDIVLIREAAQ